LKALYTWASLCLAITLTSCEGLFQFNPNQVIFRDSDKNLNAKNIEKIQKVPPTDTLKFILMGDSQRWYDESSDFVKSANSQKGISFALHAGDISDFGLSQEYIWVHDIMSTLNFPYLTVIGNHDLIANGSAAYRKMYGPLNYSFEYGDNKFIFLDNSSREYAFDGTVPDVAWLRAQVNDNPENKNVVVVAHVPPFDGDFDKNLEKEYADILGSSPNVRFSLYGHQHHFLDGEFYDDGVHYYVTTSMGARGYLVVSTWKDGYKVEKVEF
jgi:Icc protein